MSPSGLVACLFALLDIQLSDQAAGAATHFIDHRLTDLAVELAVQRHFQSVVDQVQIVPGEGGGQRPTARAALASAS